MAFPFLTLAAIAASLISAIYQSESQKKAENLAKKNIESEEEYKQKIYEQQEKQRKENEKARKKAALQAALRIPGSVSPEQVEGVPPNKVLSDASITKSQSLANIFKGISGALGQAASVWGSGTGSNTYKGTSGIDAIYFPNQINPYA